MNKTMLVFIKINKKKIMMINKLKMKVETNHKINITY
jgi:hypothetical protein